MLEASRAYTADTLAEVTPTQMRKKKKKKATTLRALCCSSHANKPEVPGSLKSKPRGLTSANAQGGNKTIKPPCTPGVKEEEKKKLRGYGAEDRSKNKSTTQSHSGRPLTSDAALSCNLLAIFFIFFMLLAVVAP